MNATRFTVSYLRLCMAKPEHVFFASKNGAKMQILPVRHKGTIKIFRKTLPKYKRSLTDLPPLTKLLTEPEDSKGLSEALRLRQEKIELYKEYLPIGTNTNLLEALFGAHNDIDSLLRIIDENLETMTSFYVGVSFEAIDDMLRAELCDKGTVIVSPEFRRLCTKALYKIRFFDADEVLKLVRCLSSLQMPDDTLIVQAALNMARHLINEFNQDELKVITSSYDLLKATKFIATDKDKAITIEDDKDDDNNNKSRIG